MTPAAYHRQVEPGSVSKFFVGLASLLVALAMIPLMTGLSLEVYLVGQIILYDQATSAIIATALFGIFAVVRIPVRYEKAVTRKAMSKFRLATGSLAGEVRRNGRRCSATPA